MKRLLVAIAMLFSVCAAQAADSGMAERSALNAILKRGELRVGLDAGYMPFEMRDKSGDIIGFDIDLARLMARYMGVKLTIVNTQWDGIIPALLTDKFDILMGGMTITPERNLKVNFCDPYVLIGQTILLRPGLKNTIKSYRDLNDLRYTISSKLGTTGDIAARRYLPKAKLKQYESESEGAMEVRSGRVDGFVYDLPFNAVYVAQNPDKVIHLKEPFTQEALGWAVRKGDPDMLNWLNNFLAQSKRDGTYDALYKKWFEGTAWLKNLK
ncbi:MAG: transporter substrate-binding domain-containing protein [Pseudomonadota bacterium]